MLPVPLDFWPRFSRIFDEWKVPVIVRWWSEVKWTITDRLINSLLPIKPDLLHLRIYFNIVFKFIILFPRVDFYLQKFKFQKCISFWIFVLFIFIFNNFVRLWIFDFEGKQEGKRSFCHIIMSNSTSFKAGSVHQVMNTLVTFREVDCFSSVVCSDMSCRPVHVRRCWWKFYSGLVSWVC